MRYLCVLVATLACAAVASGQCTCNPCTCSDCDCGPAYGIAHTAAVRDNQPLVVFVYQPAVALKGCSVCRYDKYLGVVAPAVIIGLPDGKGEVDEVARIEGKATPAQVSKRVQELLARRAAAEYRQKHPDLMRAPVYQPPFFPTFQLAFGTFSRRGGC